MELVRKTLPGSKDGIALQPFEKKILEEINFPVYIKQTFDFDKFIFYYREYGEVDGSFMTPDGYNLGRYIARVRGALNGNKGSDITIDDDLILKKLEAIGFYPNMGRKNKFSLDEFIKEYLNFVNSKHRNPSRNKEEEKKLGQQLSNIKSGRYVLYDDDLKKLAAVGIKAKSKKIVEETLSV